MSRYIDADALLKNFDSAEQIGFGIIETAIVKDFIINEPTADVVEHKRGEWIQHVNEPSLWSCSICETVIYSEHEEDRLKFHKWCGCCGADMRGDTNEQIH